MPSFRGGPKLLYLQRSQFWIQRSHHHLEFSSQSCFFFWFLGSPSWPRVYQEEPHCSANYSPLHDATLRRFIFLDIYWLRGGTTFINQTLGYSLLVSTLQLAPQVLVRKLLSLKLPLVPLHLDLFNRVFLLLATTTISATLPVLMVTMAVWAWL